MRTIWLSGPVVLALTAAGCGGGSPTGDVAHLGTGRSTTNAAGASSDGASPGAGQGASAAGAPGSGSGSASALSDQAVAYARCMHSHGVPNFPEPQVSTHASSNGNGNEVSVKVAAPAGAVNGNPHFHSAQQACRNLLPGGGPGEQHVSPQEQAQFLRLAACIRSHGVPNFPDPTFSGGGVHLPQGSVNPRSPQVRAAEQACRSLIPASARGGG